MTQQKDGGQAVKLAGLRAEMAKQGLQGYIVPRADEYQGEYVPECGARLAWLTGFTGSAGMAAVLTDKAVVMSDSRYTLQLKEQVDASFFETVSSQEGSKGLAGWIAQSGKPGGKIGYDPRLWTGKAVEDMNAILKVTGMTLEAVEGNLIDAVWKDRPESPASPVIAHPESLNGRSASAKRQIVANDVVKDRGYAVVINAPECVMWMLNVRGNDVPCTPFALSTAVVYEDGKADWFIKKDRVSAEIAKGLGDEVKIVDPDTLEQALDDLAAAAKTAGKPVLVDDRIVPIWFRQRLEKAGAEVTHQVDPCLLPKARKTPEEQAAIRAAHVQDGVALTRFLKWASEELPKGQLTEIDASDRLKAFRKETAQKMGMEFRDLSFDTISGSGRNAAIVHYKATKESNATIVPPCIYLLDSGAQYLQGTTDVTRTTAIGEPTDEQRDRFTRVLKGHIAIADFKFPPGTTGADIDPRARKALKEAGLDYGHGTGHGVDQYLSVHASAHGSGYGISSRANLAFMPDMLVSNEPGYYKEGAYGIRIENLVLTHEEKNGLYGFETLTLAPIDRNLIDVEMLDREELAWLNDYHKRVCDTLSLHLDPAERQWLQQACAELKKNVTPKAQPSAALAPA